MPKITISDSFFLSPRPCPDLVTNKLVRGIENYPVKKMWKLFSESSQPSDCPLQVCLVWTVLKTAKQTTTTTTTKSNRDF